MRLAAVLLVALVLRLVCAVRRSLWLDEFHTLYHAGAADLGTLLTGLRDDNHPPLSFLLVRASRALLGDAELALRLPSILCGLATVWITARLARRLPDSRASLYAPLLVAVSALHVVVSAEARMYALTSLAVVGLLAALLDAHDGVRARVGVRVALWCVVGLHAHYFFLHFLLVIGAASLVLFRGSGRARWGAPLAGVVVAVLLAVPWYAWGFQYQFFHHVLRPGGQLDPWRSLPEAFVHLAFHNLRLGGDGPRAVFLGAAALLVPLTMVGLLRGWRAPRGSSERALLVLAAAAGLAVPVWAACVAWLLPRSGFNWVYIAASAAPFALVVAAQARTSRAAGAALAVVALAAGTLSAINAHSAGTTEDFRPAVRWILEDRGPDDPVLSIEPGPWFFPPALGWTWYSPRLAADAPAALPLSEKHLLEDPSVLDGHERAYLLERGLGPRFPTIELLRERYALEREVPFGFSLRVHRFASPRPAEERRRSAAATGG